MQKVVVKAAEWQRLFIEQRSHKARAGIHVALLLNGGAAVTLLAFLGRLVGASEHAAYRVDFSLVRYAFGTFGGGVFLATVTYLFMYQISSLRTQDHLLDKRFPARTINTLGRDRSVCVCITEFPAQHGVRGSLGAG